MEKTDEGGQLLKEWNSSFPYGNTARGVAETCVNLTHHIQCLADFNKQLVAEDSNTAFKVAKLTDRLANVERKVNALGVQQPAPQPRPDAESDTQYLVMVSTTLDDVPVRLCKDIGFARYFAERSDIWDEAKNVMFSVLSRDTPEITGVYILTIQNGSPVSYEHVRDYPDELKSQSPAPTADEESATVQFLQDEHKSNMLLMKKLSEDLECEKERVQMLTSEKAHLTKKLEEYADTIERHKKNMSDSQRGNVRLQRENAEALERCAELEKQAIGRLDFDSLVSDVAAVKELIHEVALSLPNAITKDANEVANRVLQSQWDAAIIDRDKARAEIERLKEENASLMAKVEQLREAVQRFELLLSKETTGAEMAIRDRDDARRDLDGAMRGITRLTNDVVALRARVAEVERLKEENASLRAKVEAMRLQWETLPPD